MGLRRILFLVFAIVLATVFSLGFASRCLFQSAEGSEAQAEVASFRFFVSLRSVDWGARAFDVDAEIHVDASPYNLSYPIPPFLQYWYGGASYSSKQSGDAMPLSSRMMGPGPPYYFDGNVTTGFQLVGPTSLYPFDRYMLNITFVLPLHVQEWNVSASSIINQDNTWFYLNCRVGEFDWGPYVGNQTKFSSITYELSTASEGPEAGVEWVSLNCISIIFRPSSSTDLIMTVLGICYALVGSLPLIKPDKLEYRLSVCLSLFVFSVTFSFTIPAPTVTRATLAEVLVLILLTAAGMFSIVSIVEKALIEVRQRLIVCRYFAEGVILWVLVLQLTSSLTFLASTNASMPWASVPSTLFISLGISLFYGYVAVAFAAVFNFVRRNRSRISKRLGALRVRGRQRA